MIREIPSGGHIVRWAKLHNEYDGVSLVRSRDPGTFVELLHLRLSNLNPPFLPFADYQRVCVVSGIHHREQFGRIVDFDAEDPLITIVAKNPFPTEEEPVVRFKIHMRYLARWFFRGDKIKVVRGKYENREGYVVNLHVGGSAEFST